MKRSLHLSFAPTGYALLDGRVSGERSRGKRPGLVLSARNIIAVAVGAAGGLAGTGLGLLLAGSASAVAGGVYGTVLGCFAAAMGLTDIPALIWLFGLLAYATNVLAYLCWPH